MMSKNDIDSYYSMKYDNLSEDTCEENNKCEKTEDKISPRQENSRSLLQRVFGKMEYGSLRGSIFNLIILTLGPGCLAIPKAVGDMSLIIGLISLVLSALATYWTLLILGTTSNKYRIFKYSDLVRHLLGNKLGIFVDATILVGMFGILILYQVLVNKMLGEIIYIVGGYYVKYENLEEFLTKSFWSYLYVKLSVMYGITITIILPLCLLKDVSKLGVSSLLGILTFLFITIVLIAQSPNYINNYWTNIYKKYDPSTHLNILDLSSGFDNNLFFFKGTATFFFFYACHSPSFPVFSSLKDNNAKRIHKVIKRVLLTITFLFVIIAIFGYLTCPIKTPPLIIERDSIRGGKDIYMSLCKLSFIIILIMKLPIVFNTFKISFFQLFFEDAQLTNKRNWVISITTLFICVIISILYDRITEYLQLIGGFICTNLAYVIPVLIFLKENNYPAYHLKILGSLVFILISITIGYTSGVLTIIDIINGKT